MKILIGVVALLLGIGTGLAAPLLMQPSGDVWVPVADVHVGDGGFGETMLWVSGVSYGLTQYSFELRRAGEAQLFCMPQGLVTSPEVFDILRQRYAGEHVPPEQAMAAIVEDFRARHPCG